jgi:hypothetical protein
MSVFVVKHWKEAVGEVSFGCQALRRGCQRQHLLAYSVALAKK